MSKMVVITMLRGEFIHPAWREEGTVIEVDERIAERWIAFGSAVLGGELPAGGESTQTAAVNLGSFADFPGSDKFAAAGITSIDAVKAFVAEKGDAWPKTVGITKAVAAKVSAALEQLGQPAQDPKTEPTA